MDARRRLFALLVALVCAMGWVPSASARASAESVVAGDSRGVLPGRLPEAPPAEPSEPGDDPALPPPEAIVPGDGAAWAGEPGRAAQILVRTPRRVRPASPRGPPAIA